MNSKKRFPEPELRLQLITAESSREEQNLQSLSLPELLGILENLIEMEILTDTPSTGKNDALAQGLKYLH